MNQNECIFQVYFTITIDGRQIHSVENTDPRTFTNVRVFAGDNFKPAANASYRNFHAGPDFYTGSNVQKNKQIGTLDSWGPLFRVSLDLIIHSYVEGAGSILSFKGNGGIRGCCEHGDRIPSIFVIAGYLQFRNSVRRYADHPFDFEINLNTWYNILIEQKVVNRKVK